MGSQWYGVGLTIKRSHVRAPARSHLRSNSGQVVRTHVPVTQRISGFGEDVLYKSTFYITLHYHTHTHTHTHTRLTALFLGLPRWAGTRKVKPIWILLKQETVSGSGISWAICKSAPRFRQITTQAPHRSVFYRLVTRGWFRSWQCKFFERTKAPLGWTALILDVSEETTIGTNLRNSFNMSYGVTISRNINIPRNNQYAINTNKLQTGPKTGRAQYLQQVAKN